MLDDFRGGLVTPKLASREDFGFLASWAILLFLNYVLNSLYAERILSFAWSPLLSKN
jgi:hypothetical protein